MEKLAFTLELLNGVIVILSGFLFAWLTFHLWDRYYHSPPMTWWSLIAGVAGGMSLAFYLSMEQVGTLLVRGMVLKWRYGGARVPFTSWENVLFSLGATLIALSILLMIRLLSRPRFGETPWIASGLLVVLYVITRTVIHYV